MLKGGKKSLRYRIIQCNVLYLRTRETRFTHVEAQRCSSGSFSLRMGSMRMAERNCTQRIYFFNENFESVMSKVCATTFAFVGILF